jgi:hypothetical protein
MSLYYFNLKDNRDLVLDPEGTDLADERAAREHAVVVAREIMRNNLYRPLSWRLEVCDAQRQPCFDVLFASVSQELEHYTPQFRELVERISRSMATLADDIKEVRNSLRQTRAMLSRADRMPYLAAVNGRRVDPAA